MFTPYKTTKLKNKVNIFIRIIKLKKHSNYWLRINYLKLLEK